MHCLNPKQHTIMNAQDQELQATLIHDITELRYLLGDLMKEERVWEMSNRRFVTNYYGHSVDKSPFRKDSDACYALILEGEKALAEVNKRM